MKELLKIESKYYNNIYQNTRIDGVKITCILDNFCVRYTKSKEDKIIYKKEFKNDEKEKCFKLATRALNK